MMSEEVERIKNIKLANEKRWLAIEGVVAVGIGTTSSGTAGLIISVKERTPNIRKQIPLHIDDIDIEIRETGEIRAL
jgi:hypothetical protein